MYSVIIILFTTGFVGSASICLAQDSPWTKKADIPSPRWFLSASAVNGKIYAIGGVDNYKKVEEYDPATDIWATKAPMPTGRAFLATNEIDGKIYAIGGGIGFGPEDGLAATEEYDPATDTWTAKADMPTPRHGVCAGVVDEKIYVIGGLPPVKKMEIYDPATDTWTPKQDMPTARWAPTCAVANGKIYVFGGILYTGGPCTNVVEMYDPASDIWTPKAQMPGARAGQATAVVDGKIHIFGGTTRGGGSAFINHWIYDRTTDTWDSSLANMPFKWFVMGYSVMNERVYLMAGSAVRYPHGDQLKKVYEYTPPGVTGVEDIFENKNTPTEFALHQNYPNPFNPETRISYKVSQQTRVLLQVMNLLGQEVRTLVDADKPAGFYEVTWDGKDATGRKMASGVYVYRLETKGLVQSRKMVLLQ